MMLSLATFALRAPVVVPASTFEQELSYRTVTAITYAGAPLASHDSTTRAKVLTTFARCHDVELHPGATFAGVEASTGAGRRQGKQMASYHWIRDGQRVACKSAGLRWDASQTGWCLRFADVQLSATDGGDAAFDELQLAVYTPEEVHVFQHDLHAGVSTNGKRTATMGHTIQFVGPRNELDWRVALGEILGKMKDRGCKLLGSVDFDDPRLAAAIVGTPMPMSASAYEGVPLIDCGAKARSDVLSRLVRRLDEGWLHDGATFAEPVAGQSVDGRRRAPNQVGYQWQRDGRRVACKSAALNWAPREQRWELRFFNVKLSVVGGRDAAFDELLLVAYTPRGVHVLRHDLKAGVSTNGKKTAVLGQQIAFYGPKYEMDWPVALGEILGKMEERGCKPLACVPWGPESQHA